jgi:hypothetical protein
LIDVYSDEWLAGRNLNQYFSPHLLAEIDEEHGSTDYRNHLLVVCLQVCRGNAAEELAGFYPPFAKFISGYNHEPDFLFINFHTRQMLCIGLARKNRFFMIDAATYESVEGFGIDGCSNDDYVEKFIALDHSDVVEDLATALYNLGHALDDFCRTPGNPQTVVETLESEPDPEGLRYFEGEDEGYSREELLDFQQIHEDSDRRCKAEMSVINTFFPEVYGEGEFNTGDY